MAVAKVRDSIIHAVRPTHSWWTAPTHPRVTPPTTHHANAVRPEE